MTDFNIERECRERAEPFCNCVRKHHPSHEHNPHCPALTVAAALLKMAEDTRRECASWVNVADRLPSLTGDYLVARGGKVFIASLRTFYADTGRWGGSHPQNDMTHWLDNLPELAAAIERLGKSK